MPKYRVYQTSTFGDQFPEDSKEDYESYSAADDDNLDLNQMASLMFRNDMKNAYKVVGSWQQEFSSKMNLPRLDIPASMKCGSMDAIHDMVDVGPCMCKKERVVVAPAQVNSTVEVCFDGEKNTIVSSSGMDSSVDEVSLSSLSSSEKPKKKRRFLRLRRMRNAD